MDSNTIHLVLGVSGVGKSFFIDRQSQGQWKGLPCLLAAHVTSIPKESCVIHYNAYRPAYSGKTGRLSASDDPVLSLLISHSSRIRGYFLVLDRNSLLKHLLLRDDVGHHKAFFTHQSANTDLAQFHSFWFDFLRQNSVPFDVLHFQKGEYKKIGEPQALDILKSRIPVEYSAADVRRLQSLGLFEYQKLDLGNLPAIPGKDRSNILRLVDNDLTGKSVLDIGCSCGFFCFKAEKRNASKVAGTEIRPNRYMGAVAAGEILRSKSRFLYQDVLSKPLNEKFDTVFLLNVLHHVQNPIEALTNAARMCSRRMILEYPTPADPVFNNTILGATATFDPRIPLIGVSSTGRDQFFVFSDAAIQRILTDHQKLFSSIEFHESADTGRRVAVCTV